MWEMTETIETDDWESEAEGESPDVIRVREKLLKYAERPNTRLRNIEAYVDLYKAIEHSGKSRRELFYILKAYRELTGIELPKTTAATRIKKMREIGI